MRVSSFNMLRDGNFVNSSSKKTKRQMVRVPNWARIARRSSGTEAASTSKKAKKTEVMLSAKSISVMVQKLSDSG